MISDVRPSICPSVGVPVPPCVFPSSCCSAGYPFPLGCHMPVFHLLARIIYHLCKKGGKIPQYQLIGLTVKAHEVSLDKVSRRFHVWRPQDSLDKGYGDRAITMSCKYISMTMNGRHSQRFCPCLSDVAFCSSVASPFVLRIRPPIQPPTADRIHPAASHRPSAHVHTNHTSHIETSAGHGRTL